MNNSLFFRGIAFDLDGTLVDSAPGLTSAVDKALYALELPAAGEDRVVTWIGNGADILIERALRWAINEKTASGAEPDPEQCRIMRKLFDGYYAQDADDGSFLFPGVIETLTALRLQDIALALVTNKPTPFVAPMLASLGLIDTFSLIIGGDDVEHKKPHPEPILRVMDALNLSPEDLLFVGDSRNDIQAAQAAGCRSAGLTYGYNYGESIALSQPDYIIDRLHELLTIVGLQLLEESGINQ